MWHSSKSFSAAVAVVVASLVGGAGPAGLWAGEAAAEAGGDRYLVASKASDRLPSELARRVAAVGGTVEASYPAIGVAVVAGLTDTAAAGLAKAPDIGAVVPDTMIAGAVPAGLGEPEAAPDASADSPSNPAGAARYARQWHLRAIGAEQAWKYGHLGSPNVTVAILDTGIGYTHVDLAGRVDLKRSKSFIPSDDALVAANFPGKHPVTDLHYHGTHVAATVSSNADRAAGVSSKVTLLGVKVLGQNGFGPRSAILAGLLYATDNDADVINLSLGEVFEKDGNGQLVALLNRAVTYAHRRGVTVVASAGNDATDLDHDGNAYKAFCSSPTVTCVAATGPTSGGTDGPWDSVDAPAPYSNYGRSAISVAAPGGNQPFVWAACSPTVLQVQPRPSKPTNCKNATTLILGVRGTSMAAAHVSGLAALLVEQLGRNPGRIRSALQRSADDLGQPGTDPYYGKGRISVPRALGLPQ